MKKIKKNDRVVVIAGRDKGKTGSVTRLLDDGRVYVSGINVIKRHTKGNPQLNQPGGIIEKEAPIQLSNISIYNSTTNKADKVGFQMLESGERVRVYKSTGARIDE